MERIINAEAIKHKGQYRKQGYVHYQKRLSKDQENTFCISHTILAEQWTIKFVVEWMQTEKGQF